MKKIFTKGIDGKKYRIEQETWFHPGTHERVILLLCQSHAHETRYRIHYGDPKTGKAWGDVETGHVGRSTGDIKIPLLIRNKRSMGGTGILSHCIVKIEHANKKDGIRPLFDLTK